jgi:nitrite reductase/ring-hydroxylating ferredoxin subunit
MTNDNKEKNNRRDFLKKTGAMIGATVFSGTIITALCSCEKDEFSPIVSQDLTIDLAKYPDLQKVGGVASISVVGQNNTSVPLLLKRLTAATFGVYSDLCPHRGVPVQLGETDFYCPAHGLRFSEDDGKVTKDPNSIGVTQLNTYVYTFDQSKNVLTVKIT